ncbi:MAG: hypothetical protein U1A77_02075 [Pirellulales bacterium]
MGRRSPRGGGGGLTGVKPSGVGPAAGADGGFNVAVDAVAEPPRATGGGVVIAAGPAAAPAPVRFAALGFAPAGKGEAGGGGTWGKELPAACGGKAVGGSKGTGNAAGTGMGGKAAGGSAAGGKAAGGKAAGGKAAGGSTEGGSTGMLLDGPLALALAVLGGLKSDGARVGANGEPTAVGDAAVCGADAGAVEEGTADEASGGPIPGGYKLARFIDDSGAALAGPPHFSPHSGQRIAIPVCNTGTSNVARQLRQ